MMVVEEIPPFYVKHFQHPEKRYINVKIIIIITLPGPGLFLLPQDWNSFVIIKTIKCKYLMKTQI